ncbi:T9SS type B sorting domain-containing protein [Maribacter antarcticus]|uniref:T9SS type B sorting domain-containing protein n=1 Tax=Maribacter antarcticus TaxID=505250 RepID=UPI00047DCE0D|nr:T9SS type B sorting domain-containing protein [Maribacter antarcticus]
MRSKKPWYTLYALLLILVSAIGSSAIANYKVHVIFEEVASVLKKVGGGNDVDSKTAEYNSLTLVHTQNKFNKISIGSITPSAPMFSTIIQGADEEVGCSVQGFTVARFNLCGDYDDRTISLSGGPYGAVSWQILGGSCTPDINEDCPNTGSCYTEVATGATFNLDASTIPAATGAEFIVVADGQTFYFKVKKSNITQTFVKQDNICGVLGRIQITNLSSAYEFSMDGGTSWQGPIFQNLGSGTYHVRARLQNTANTCEYPYEPIIINKLDIGIQATFVDAQCSGDTGSITVTATNVPGPYKYTLLNSGGVAQEFTAFIPDNPYTFSAVGFGTYTVQVETQQCTGDPLNGINPPRQSLDTSGNPIRIGAGLNAMDASTEVNSSFGCATISDVDITLNTNGGSAPYTFTVNGGAVQPSFGDAVSNSGTTVFNVTSAGTYDFIITDSNGCSITASSNVEELLPPDITASGFDGTCSNGGAQIDFTVNDARGYNLSFRVNSGDAWVSTPQISVPAGNYPDIEVRYQQGGFECVLSLPTVAVTNVGVISGSAAKISDVTCDGSGGTIGGQIDFVGPFTGGSGSGYVFSIDGVNFTSTTSYTGLATGTYTPIIRDGGGCRLELTPIDILDVDPPTDLNFVQDNVNCAVGTSDVILTATSNVNIARYEVISPTPGFDNDGDNTNNIITGLSTGTSYIFRITDDNGCTYTEGFSPVIVSSVRVRVMSGGDLRVCNGASDGTGTFIVDGFANSYTYEINGGGVIGPQNDTEVDLPLSGAGTYAIMITDDDTGCTATASFDIEEAVLLDLSSSTVTPMSCANGNVGRVRANNTGGWGGNRYVLTPPSGPSVGPKSGRTFNNLTLAGTYTLLVEDAEGCTDTFTFDLTPIDAPILSLDNAASNFCYVPSTGATAVVTSNEGTAALGTHQYRINGGTLQPNGTFTDLTPGNYTIEVVDANNCSDSITITIAQQLRIYTSIVTEIPCGGTPGQIQVQVTGGYASGTGMYEVSADNGATFGAPVPYTSSTFLYDTTVDGTYIFRITDNNVANAGCEASSAPLILNPSVNNAAASVIIRPVSCGETSNGVVTIMPNATSGIPPYEVNFNGLGWSNRTVYSNLSVGNYPYIVRDSRGCETVPDDAIIVLDNTTPPDASVSEQPALCDGSGTLSGGIIINGVTDGLANFDFRIEDTTGTEIVRQENVDPSLFPLSILDVDLVPGDYTVITLDANGCTDIDIVTITSNEVVITPIPPPLPPTCDDSAFTYAVSVSGGSGAYEIRLIQQPSFYPLNNTPGFNDHTFSNTTDGIQFGIAYTVQVRDTGTGCIYEQEIPPIDAPSTLDITANSTPGACDLNRNGEITYEVTGYVIGNELRIELLDNDTNTTTVLIPSVITVAIPFIGSHPELPGDYQIIVVNLTDTCRAAVGIVIDQNLPAIDIISDVPAICNAFGQITVQGRGGGGGPYEYAFIVNGAPEPVYPTGYDIETTFVAAAGDYDVYVRDASGCTSFDIATVIRLDPDLPAPTFTVINQCDPTSTSFDITVRMPDTVNTPRFTLAGNEQPANLVGSFWEYTYMVSSPGDYIVDVVDANGCASQGTATVFNFLSAFGGFTSESTCNDADGEITITTFGGSGDFSFVLTGMDYNSGVVGPITQINNSVFNSLEPGNYEVLITDRIVNDGSGFCEFTVTDINLNQAAQLVIVAETATDINCRDANDGTVEVVIGPANTLVPFTSEDSPITYILNNLTTSAEQDRNNTGSFSNLLAGDYQVQVLTARGCEGTSAIHTINNPLDFSITASAPDFACEPRANRFSSTVITVSVVDVGTLGSGYQYSITGFSNYQTAPTFEIIDNGAAQNITVYAIDGNGCQTTFNVPTINPPTVVVPTIIAVDALNCRDDERARIQVVGTADFTVSVVSVTAVLPVTNTPGDNFADIFLPAAGDYLFEITDNSGGCTYPLPTHTVNEPIPPLVLISEANPVSCFGANDGELFIEITDYIGTFDYTVYMANDTARTTPIANGSFDTNNFPDINGHAARILGLRGGNLIVEVVSTAMPFCSNDSNVTNIRTPNGALQVSAVQVGNVGCGNTNGEIEAIGQGGWDAFPYEYRLMQSADAGATYSTEVAPFSTINEFTGLAFGFYQVEITDAEGCIVSFDIELEEVPQIDAGIRQPQGLDCPNGNNAVLETFDSSTGDAITATPGATGGLAGAGYNYRLLYLNGNDNTNIHSTSGLQNSPTFIGASGGFISAGWYAIEVSSSFDCLFVTAPYFVNPPPPIEPLLLQTRVPGCGGYGEMRLSIENPDPLFNYQYLPIENGVAIGTYVDMLGTSVLIPGVQGITYQFDVRKINILSICLPVRSNGITMTDATGITILPNLPDDISCASELDGRIESFVNGGVGDDLFYLYMGDPVDAFSPAVSATLVRGPQADGTFEGLPQGAAYYIAVTSGAACMDVVGPFEIERPDPIIFDANPTPVTCNGGEDGTITVAVLSGGVGLTQFAIAPNFNEFFIDSGTPGVYTFEGLATGTYEILILDENGCFEKDFITVTEPDELQVINIQTTPELCVGANDGRAIFEFIGGTPFNDLLVSTNPYFEYKVEMIDPIDETGTGTFAPYVGELLENLQGGASYVISVQDANFCATTELFTVGIGVNLTAEPIVQYGCEGIFPNSTVTVQLQDNSLMNDVMFALDPVDPTDAITALAGVDNVWGNLPAGDHIVYVYHQNGCAIFVEFSVDAYDPLTLTAIKTGPNEMEVAAEGGFGGYEYFFNGDSYGDMNTFTTNESMTVNARVVDANGCIVEVAVPFEFTGMLDIPNFFTPDGDNLNDIWSVKNKEFFPNIEVRIYDRYGRVVANLKEISGWDGTYDGSEVPTGDYWYVINANNKEKQRYVGHFTLYR